MMKNFIISVFVTVLLLPACEKVTTINPIPVIKFKEFTLTQGIDSSLGNLVYEGKLLFGFSDDDGADLNNVPLKDTIYSIFTTPFIKNPDNSYVESDLDTVYYLIYDEDMNINKVGQNKTLHGDIEITKYYFIVPADTIRYEIYITDRNGNKSNVETTYDIGFR
jgi:hypothetical protein